MKESKFRYKLSTCYDYLYFLKRNKELNDEQRSIVIKAIESIDSNYDWDKDERIR